MNGAKQTSAGAGEYIDLRLSILYKNPPQTAFVFIHNRVFGTDALFIRTKSTVGARSAQVFVARDHA